MQFNHESTRIDTNGKAETGHFLSGPVAHRTVNLLQFDSDQPFFRQIRVYSCPLVVFGCMDTA